MTDAPEPVKIFTFFHKEKDLIKRVCLIFLYLSISLIKIAEFHSLHKSTQKNICKHFGRSSISMKKNGSNIVLQDLQYFWRQNISCFIIAQCAPPKISLGLAKAILIFKHSLCYAHILLTAMIVKPPSLNGISIMPALQKSMMSHEVLLP